MSANKAKKMHRSGFVNIIGNPNVGKSTLMNALVGEKLSIITSKAQTTRHRIMGIVSGEDFQIVYSDTPGILKPSYKLQESMMKFVTGALTDADVILYVTDTVEQSERSAEIVDSIRRSGIPTVVVINKIDLSTPDVMRIRGGAIRPARVFSHGDHRIAMSMAVSALRSSGAITIEGAEAVAKSYPRFFEDLESLRVN